MCGRALYREFIDLDIPDIYRYIMIYPYMMWCTWLAVSAVSWMPVSFHPYVLGLFGEPGNPWQSPFPGLSRALEGGSLLCHEMPWVPSVSRAKLQSQDSCHEIAGKTKDTFEQFLNVQTLGFKEWTCRFRKSSCGACHVSCPVNCATIKVQNYKALWRGRWWSCCCRRSRCRCSRCSRCSRCMITALSGQIFASMLLLWHTIQCTCII